MDGCRCCRLIITQTIIVALQGYQRPHAGTDCTGRLIIWSMLNWVQATTGWQKASHLCGKSACSSRQLRNLEFQRSLFVIADTPIDWIIEPICRWYQSGCVVVGWWFYVSYMIWTQYWTQYWTHNDVIKWKQFPRYWLFVWGIHRSPVNSSHKGQWRGALMFSLICAWINGWVKNRDAGELRRHRTHYDVTVMCAVDWWQ